jgi:nitrogen fixation-related uncharacterized protein
MKMPSERSIYRIAMIIVVIGTVTFLWAVTNTQSTHREFVAYLIVIAVLLIAIVFFYIRQKYEKK